jgi:hypothetical protein
MSSGRGGAGNVRLNTGSGLKGKGRMGEDTVTTFFGREISTVFQNVRSARFPRLVPQRPTDSLLDNTLRQRWRWEL